MPTIEAYQWENEVLGERVEFPGHPTILAIMVMDRYESFDHAGAREEGAHYYNATRDGFIVGAGCAVSSTMDVLKLAIEKGPEAAFIEAKRYWQGWENQSPSNKDRAAFGREQAERVKPLFLQRLASWQNCQLEPSKWRLSSVGFGAR